MIDREALRGIDVVGQARGLLGVRLVTEVDGAPASGRIVETEAYRGRDDRASHAYPLKRTRRTEVCFGAPGHAYVYLCYGIHRMFNVVCGPVGEPNVVLVRAVEPVGGVDVMLARRGLAKPQRRVAGGPGLVCEALGIALGHNRADLFDPAGPLRLEGAFGSVPDVDVEASPRVGIAYAGGDASRPWRFRERGSPFTSPAN